MREQHRAVDDRQDGSAFLTVENRVWITDELQRLVDGELALAHAFDQERRVRVDVVDLLLQVPVHAVDRGHDRARGPRPEQGNPHRTSQNNSPHGRGLSLALVRVSTARPEPARPYPSSAPPPE